MSTHVEHTKQSHQQHMNDEAGAHQQHDGQMNHDEHDTHAGHGAHGASHMGHEIMFRNRFWVSLVLTIPVLIFSSALQNWLGYTAPQFPGSNWITPVFSVIIFIYGGIPFLQMAGWELRDRKPGMMTLISLAISVAFVFSMATLIADLGESFFWELVTLIDVMLLGHWIEMRSVRQASGALDALAKLMPDMAEVIMADGSVEEYPVIHLETDDVVLVRPGASIPADGVVIDGRSDVNEAMITGESKPVTKTEGSNVIGGTVNTGDSSLRVQVTAVGDESALSGIMRLVEEAQRSKSSTQLLADRAAAWLFYAALAAAVLTAVAWTVAVGFNATTITRVVTVLVIACPHALGLAVPLVVANTTSIAANNGILIRDRRAMETAKDLDIVTFDKTGTLTKGEQGIVDMMSVNASELNNALALTAAIEGDSEHPIARAIRNSAEKRELSLPEIDGFEIMKGRGVRATYQGTNVYVGGPRLLEHLNTKPPADLLVFSDEAGEKGQSVIYLLHGNKPVAAFALADVVRKESGVAVKALHDMNVQVAMLTGDSQDVAKAVADELNIDHYFAEVLPEDKDKKVIELQGQGNEVAMVGDGVNDAPALTRANVGIAIGSGTDVAVESAGLILVKSNPLDVVKIIKLSRASYRKMVQNIWWAAGYNLIAIPLAAGLLAPWGIVLPPAVGALVMSLSTIVVAINAQLLRRESLDVAM